MNSTINNFKLVTSPVILITQDMAVYEYLKLNYLPFMVLWLLLSHSLEITF